MRFSPYQWTKADLIGGNLALDFVNTASQWASGDPIDRLGGPEGLADWALVAGIVDGAGADRLKASASGMFAQAVGLRALIWRLFDAAAHGRKAATRDLSDLRDWTCRARAAQEIVQTGDGFEERWKPGAGPSDRVLFGVSLAAEKLLTEGPLDRLHACGGADCEWMFLDLSKNASRRWCSMATCGNSAKIRKFRTRKKAGGQ